MQPVLLNDIVYVVIDETALALDAKVVVGVEGAGVDIKLPVPPHVPPTEKVLVVPV